MESCYPGNLTEITDDIAVFDTYINSTETHLLEKDITKYIWVVCGPLLFLMGTLCNILAFLTLKKPKLCKSATSFYLRSIVIFDTLMLIIGLPTILCFNVGCDVMVTSAILCKLRYFLVHTLGDITIWLTCVLIADCLIITCFLHTKLILYAKRNATNAVIFITFLAFVKNIPIIWTRTLVQRCTLSYQDGGNCTCQWKCSHDDPVYEYFDSHIQPWIAVVTVYIIPFFFIIICNGCILLSMRRKSKPIDGSNYFIHQSNCHIYQLTVMALAISFTFLLLLFPHQVFLVRYTYWSGTKPQESFLDMMRAIANVMRYLYHSIKMVLFYMTSQIFKEELRNLRSNSEEISQVECTCTDSDDVINLQDVNMQGNLDMGCHEEDE